MDQLFIPFLVGLTSLGAFGIGIKWLGLPRHAVWYALGRMLECLGVAVVFFMINIALGAALILGLRTVTGEFFSLYVMADKTLPGLALLQAVAFRWWLLDEQHPHRLKGSVPRTIPSV